MDTDKVAQFRAWLEPPPSAPRPGAVAVPKAQEWLLDFGASVAGCAPTIVERANYAGMSGAGVAAFMRAAVEDPEMALHPSRVRAPRRARAPRRTRTVRRQQRPTARRTRTSARR